MNMDERHQAVEQLLKRRVQNTFPSREEVLRRLVADEPMTIYWGIDPTGSQVHIGHTIPLLLLRGLAELGHRIILLIGDFTARIGDPTGKGAARTILTAEQVQKNMATYLDQVQKVLPKDSFTVAHNSEWLTPLSLEQVIKLAGMVTVQQMIQRDMFQDRLARNQPISLSEFLYPLMQGYDSVALRVDGEVGGNDQTFNMLVGRDLEKTLLQKDKFILATPLLTDSATGKKMSKSEGTLIALDDSPQEIRRKVLALDDAGIATTFRLCTQKDEQWIEDHASEPRALKEALAAELVRMYHGEEAIGMAVEAAQITATGPLDHVLKQSGLATSLSEAKRLIEQKAVSVNGDIVERWDVSIKSGDEIRVGKGKFSRVT
jgi:tyrosyl-tRNA synthetase